MLKRIWDQKASRAALLILLLLVLLALLGPAMGPYGYKEQIKNREGEILSHMPPRIPWLKFLGIAQGRETLRDRRTDYLSDPTRYPEGSILEIKNRRTSESGTDYCDVVVDYYRYMKAEEGTAFWFGTDQLGRDLWTRLWRGTRISLLIAFFTVAIDMLIGVSYGALCGYYGGKVDLFLMRICEVIQSIPNVILCTLFMLMLGRGIVTMILALAVRNWTETARLARAQVLRFKGREFVIAARTMGVGPWRILRRHILPNALGPLITSAVLAVPGAIFTESFLSFIGLGIPAPEPSIGTLLADAQSLLQSHPHQVLLPAGVIALLMISFHLLSNGLREAYDVKTNVSF